MVSLINPIKYLGHQVCTAGVLKPNINHLATWLQNIKRALLKPPQKLALIRDFVIPKINYFLQGPRTTAEQLRAADSLIRASLKGVLYLNVHTPDAALYVRVCDGSLGVQELRTTIPKITMARLTGML